VVRDGKGKGESEKYVLGETSKAPFPILWTPFEKKNGGLEQKNDSSLKVRVETKYEMNRSIISKSGKQTWGANSFYNGSISKSQKGLEISVIAVVDVSR
jgi:hypothetical protein